MKNRKLILSLIGLWILFSSARAAMAAPYEEWAGIYLGNEKMGYASLKMDGGPDGYKITEGMSAALAVLGTVQEVSMETTSIADTGFRLKSFHFKMASGYSDTEIDGTVEGDALRLKTGAGPSDTKEIKFKERPFLSTGADLYLQRQALKAGDSMELPIFDPASLSLSQMKVTVEAVENMKAGDSLVPVYRIHEDYSGVEGTSWISRTEGVLKASGPMGFTYIKEPKEQAIDFKNSSPPDIIALTAIPVEGMAVPDPRGASLMRVKLEGADLSGMALDGGRQSFSEGVISVKKEVLPLKPAQFPVKGAGLDEFLKPEPFVQSDDPAIMKKSKEITGGEKDALGAAGNIADWVHKSLRKYPSAGIPDAVEVLRNLSGDCNEHAVLFMALCRAAGIPARMDAGLIMMDGKFYYHAWDEVYVGEWVTVDPTFGQFPADATHIRLAQGGPDKQVELVKAVGKLKTEILEVK